MSEQNSSQCQSMQLHIDAYLDNELESARVSELQAHVASCEACRHELAYAQSLHRAVTGLPMLDCSDAALEPIDRLFDIGSAPQTGPLRSMLNGLAGLLVATPPLVRYAVPVAAVLVLLIGLGRGGLLGGSSLQSGTPAPQIAAGEEYSPEEIRQALRDLELAIDYLGEISARTEVMIEDRFLLRQIEESINASFFRADEDPVQVETNGPI